MAEQKIELEEVFNGLVLRAFNCKRCKKMLPVACDEAETITTLRVVHQRGGEHHIYQKHDGAEVAIWNVTPEGEVSVPFASNGIILRIQKAGPFGGKPLHYPA